MSEKLQFHKMEETVILKCLNKDIKTKQLFLGVFARDELPLIQKYPSCLIFNSKPRSNEGEHWLAIYFDANKRCYFFSICEKKNLNNRKITLFILVFC